MATAQSSVFVKIGAALTGGFNSAFQTADKRMQGLGSAIKELNGNAGQLKAFEELQAATKQAGYGWQAAKVKAQQLRDEIEAAGPPTKRQAAEIKRAEQAAERAALAFQKQREALAQMRSNLTAAGIDTRNLAAEQTRLGQALAQNEARYKRLGQIAASQAANESARSKYRTRMFDALGAGAAVGVPVGAAISSSQEFEYQLRMIGNTANMSNAEIAKLGDTIKQISKDSGQSIQVVQQAMGFLIAAGMDAKTAAATLGTVARTTTAFGAEAEDVAKAAFTLNDALKIDPKDMGAALDILATAGKEGNVELKDMAKQLPVLGSGFQALKMQGAEAAATLGAALEIARKGAADADEAANNMKNFIAKIMSPETLKKAKKNFDLDLYKVITDAQTKRKNPFEAAMVAIMKATKGDQKAIGDLFGDMQVQNFIRPMIQNWEKYEEIKKKALAGGGVTDRDFQTVMETGKLQAQQLGNAFGQLNVQVGEALGPAFNQLAQAMTPVVQFIGELVKEHPTLTAAIIGTTLAGIALAGTLAVVGFGSTYLVGGVLALQKGFLLLGPAIRMAGTAAMFLGRALVMNPIGLAVTAIAIGAALIWQYWEPIKQFFNTVWDGFLAAMDNVVAKIQTVINWGAKLKSSIGDALSSAANFIGLGGGPAPAPAGGPALPSPAAAAPTARGGGTYSPQYNVTVQGGGTAAENTDAMRRFLQQKEAEARAKARSKLYDAGGGF